MIMKSLILIFISILRCSLALAQEYTVQSFEIMLNELSARAKSRVDYNGKRSVPNYFRQDIKQNTTVSRQPYSAIRTVL